MLSAVNLLASLQFAYGFNPVVFHLICKLCAWSFHDTYSLILDFSSTGFLHGFVGSIIVMVVAIVSSVIVAMFGLALVMHIWKRREIQRKRKGTIFLLSKPILLPEEIF